MKYNVKRFHQVSTDEVYGSLDLEDDKTKFTEEFPLKGSTPYSASKASADLLCLSYYHTYKYPITISRCSNNYGYYQFPEKLIPLVVNNVLNNKKVTIHGTGDHIRDWIYVEDHIKGIELVLEKGKLGEIYNFGSSVEITTLDVVKTILNKMDKKIDDWIEYIPDRPNNDKKYSIDSTKSAKELGWKKETSFEDGISKTIDWYIKNKKWLNDITNENYKTAYEEWSNKNDSF
jgi:dTDP-glucose 4,6-dehydratase